MTWWKCPCRQSQRGISDVGRQQFVYLHLPINNTAHVIYYSLLKCDSLSAEQVVIKVMERRIIRWRSLETLNPPHWRPCFWLYGILFNEFEVFWKLFLYLVCFLFWAWCALNWKKAPPLMILSKNLPLSRSFLLNRIKIAACLSSVGPVVNKVKLAAVSLLQRHRLSKSLLTGS